MPTFPHTCTITDRDGDEALIECEFTMSSYERNASANLERVKIDGEWTAKHGLCWTDVVSVEVDAETAWQNGAYADAARYAKEIVA